MNPVGNFAQIVADASAELKETLHSKLLETKSTTVPDDIEIRTSVGTNHIKTPYDENHDAEFVTDIGRAGPSVEDLIPIFWSYENEYYSSTVSSVNIIEKFNIDYDDGDEESLDISNEFLEV